MGTRNDKKESDLRRKILSAPKTGLSLNEVADIEEYLSKEKGIETIDERIEFLKQIDPNDIDPAIKRLGLKSAAERDQMILLEEQLKDIAKVVVNSPVFDTFKNGSAFSVLRNNSSLFVVGTAVAEATAHLTHVTAIPEAMAHMQQNLGGIGVAVKAAADLQRNLGGAENLRRLVQDLSYLSNAIPKEYWGKPMAAAELKDRLTISKEASELPVYDDRFSRSIGALVTEPPTSRRSKEHIEMLAGIGGIQAQLQIDRAKRALDRKYDQEYQRYIDALTITLGVLGIVMGLLRNGSPNAPTEVTVWAMFMFIFILHLLSSK